MVSPPKHVADFGHYLDSDGDVDDGPTALVGRYLSLIVEQGSLLEVGEPRQVAMLCLDKVSRRNRCGGRLSVGRSDEETIEWNCSKCGQEGVLRNWHGTQFDFRGAAKAVAAAIRRESIIVIVPFPELWAMRRLSQLAANQRRLLADAVGIGGGYLRFDANFDDLGELQEGALYPHAFDSEDNHRLVTFAGRMGAFQSMHPEFWESPEVERPKVSMTCDIEIVGGQVQFTSREGELEVTDFHPHQDEEGSPTIVMIARVPRGRFAVQHNGVTSHYNWDGAQLTALDLDGGVVLLEQEPMN